jgi:hypothetical protein
MLSMAHNLLVSRRVFEDEVLEQAVSGVVGRIAQCNG